MSDDDRVYLQDRLTGWRRATRLEALSIFARLFTGFSILHVVIDMLWSGNVDFRAAFVNSLVVSCLLGLLSVLIKVVPVIDE